MFYFNEISLVNYTAPGLIDIYFFRLFYTNANKPMAVRK